MAIGIPAETDSSAVKPRLPQPEIVHRETYQSTERDHWINRYNATMSSFYPSST